MKITIAGDYFPDGIVKQKIDNNDFSSIFDKATHDLIEGSDYSIVNYESPIVEDDSYKPIDKDGPNLSSNVKALDALKWLGFKAVTLANNHILDYGPKALMDTISICEDSKIDNVGAGKDLKVASKILYLKFPNDNFTIALINCCEHEFSIATDNTPGANPLNPIRQYYQIQDAKMNSDFVILIIHGGHEFFQLPSPRMVETYRFFIDSGANVVVNHHQHCFSGYEIYHGCPIFYGLGNFCFPRDGKVDSSWNEGFILLLDIKKERLEFELFPYLQCNGNEQVVMLENRSDFQRKIKALNDIISNPESLRKHVYDFYDSRERIYITALSPYTHRITSALCRRHLLPSFMSKYKLLHLSNYINDEAHRDIMCYSIQEFLKKK